jgi:hypothetical protein
MPILEKGGFMGKHVERRSESGGLTRREERAKNMLYNTTHATFACLFGRAILALFLDIYLFY